MNLPKPGRSILLLGASGSGKSTTIRTALAAEGSGVALLAPGNEEYSSYTEFDGRDGYQIRGVGDAEFQPLLGMRQATGFKNAVALLRGVYLRAKYDLGLTDEATTAKLLETFGEPQGELKYKVLGVDTISGIGILAVNERLSSMGLNDAPKAQSPEGATFFTGLKSILEQFMALLDGVRGMGVDLIVTSHTMERDQGKNVIAGQIGKGAYVASIMGSFRDNLPRAFDLVLYPGVNDDAALVDGANDPNNPRHYVRWVPSSKQPTKSRVGALSINEVLPNEWQYLRDAYDRALLQRSQQSSANA